MTTRITGETRSALDDEAARTGRSIGQVAEKHIERSLALSQAGAGVEDTITRQLTFLRRLINRVGDPSASLAAREALVLGWREIVAGAYEETVEATPEGNAVRAALDKARIAAQRAIAALDGENDLPKEFCANLERVARGTLFPGLTGWAAMQLALSTFMGRYPPLEGVIEAEQEVVRATEIFNETRRAAQREARSILNDLSSTDPLQLLINESPAP